MANNLNSAGQYLCSTVATRNTFIGLNAGNATTSQIACVAVGDNCLSSLTSTGNSNTAVGDYAGYNITTGTSNTCVGTASLVSLTSGGQNVCIGHAAANSITTGSGNTCVGYFAGQSFTGAESNNVMISNVGSSYVGSNGQIAIGTAGTHTKTNIAGIYGNTPSAGGTQNVVMDSAGNMGTAAVSLPVWNTVSTNTSTPMTTNQSYLCTYSGTANLVLPTTSAVGDIMYVVSKASGNYWKITYGTGQNIVNGDNSTSVSTITTGNVQASPGNGGMICYLICVVANTQWMLTFSGTSGLFLTYT